VNCDLGVFVFHQYCNFITCYRNSCVFVVCAGCRHRECQFVSSITRYELSKSARVGFAELYRLRNLTASLSIKSPFKAVGKIRNGYRVHSFSRTTVLHKYPESDFVTRFWDRLKIGQQIHHQVWVLVHHCHCSSATQYLRLPVFDIFRINSCRCRRFGLLRRYETTTSERWEINLFWVQGAILLKEEGPQSFGVDLMLS